MESGQKEAAPVIDFLREQVEATLGKFTMVREGIVESFREYVGLEDNGEDHPTVVNTSNVDTEEQRFRSRWSSRYPDVVAADDETS